MMLRQSLTAGIAHTGKKVRARSVNTAIRHASSSSSSGGGGGGGKVVLGLGVAGMATVGATVGYAGVDNDFRRSVEDTIPGSGSLFSMIHGDLEPEKPAKKKVAPVATVAPTTTTPPSKMRTIPVPAPSTEMKLLEKSDKEALSKASIPPPPLEKPAFMKKEEKKEEAPKVEEKKKEEVKKEAPKKEVESKPKEEEVKKETAPVEEKKPKKAARRDDDDDSEETIATGKDIHRRIIAVREELESEMRTQLKRQSEAHSDHIADALDVQKKELTREHVRKLDEALESAQLGRRNELAGIVGHLKGLQVALENRSKMDAASLEAQELWLACSALQLAVESEGDQPVRSLNREIAAVRKVLANNADDPFVTSVLASIPDVAFRRGVVTTGAIKARFLKVEEMAKRTAMIGDDGGSLFKYWLSYVQSKLILEPSSLKELPDKNAATDVDSLTTFEIVWLARGSLDRGDLEQAVKYMTLLRGEPGNVAQDWVKEARLLLETKQATRALLAHAAAVGVEALPLRRKH